MNKQFIIDKTVEFVKEKMMGEGSGHDWWHVWRVWQLAIKIGQIEKADLLIVQLGALLHDIADWKFNDGDTKAGGKAATIWLKKIKVDNNLINKVIEIIDNSSFKGANVKEYPLTKEGKIVQDADRLDAIGAIGIGRTFAYGGSKNREMYNPEIQIKMANNFEEYKMSGQTTINHFYEKLFLLKDRMNTGTGKKIAEKRHKFMEQFLEEFYSEWKGKK